MFSINEIDLLHGWKKFPSQHTTFFHLTLSSLYTNLCSRQVKTSPLEGRFIPSLLSGLCPIHSLRKGSSRPEEDKKKAQYLILRIAPYPYRDHLHLSDFDIIISFAL